MKWPSGSVVDYHDFFSRTYVILFQALLLLSKFPSNLVGEPMERERLHDAIDCLLSFVV
jgi:hypothetical protein